MTEIPRTRSTTDETNAASLDKVREILFGQETRKNEKRLARLENQMQGSVDTLRGQTQKELSSLKSSLEAQAAAALEAGKADRKDRDELLAQLTKQLDELGANLARFEQRTSQSMDEMSAKIEEKLDQYKAQCEAHQRDTGERMVDRERLAQILSGVAGELKRGKNGSS